MVVMCAAHPCMIKKIASNTPTSMKFLPDRHTKVMRLPLRDHRPKPSQSPRNLDHAKNVEKSPKMKFVRFLRARVELVQFTW